MICWAVMPVPDYFPIPVRVTSWMRPSALSVIVIVPVCAPLVCGLNATWIVQLFPIFSFSVQLLRSTKLPLIWGACSIRDARSHFAVVRSPEWLRIPEKKILEVAARFDDDPDCHGWNNDSYFFEWRNPN